MWTIKKDCPDWPLLTCITPGHWTEAVAETFGHDNKPTHIHFYLCPEEARAFYKLLRHLIPPTITTVSFKYKGYAK